MPPPARAMILAAGLGTRLGPLTSVLPKPMLPICGTPLVRWAVLWLRSHGIRDIVINLHHLGELIEAELGDGRSLDVRVEYSHEEGQILGTGGGLRHARPLIDDGNDTPIVVVNGKLMLDLDLADVLAHHRSAGTEATMVLRPDDDIQRWGTPLHVDGSGRVASLLGAGPSVGVPLMFTGVHVMQPRFLDRVPPSGEQCVIRTAYRALFEQGAGPAAYVTKRYWWEHSTLDRYLGGMRNVLDGRVPLPYAEHALSGIDPTARIAPDVAVTDPIWIGAGVTVESGCSIGPHVQLGVGARVGSGVRLRNAIAWDGVHVAHDLDGEVIPA